MKIARDETGAVVDRDACAGGTISVGRLNHGAIAPGADAGLKEHAAVPEGAVYSGVEGSLARDGMRPVAKLGCDKEFAGI